MKNVFRILAIFIFAILAIALDLFILYQSTLTAGESTGWSTAIVDVIANLINIVAPETINETNYADFSNVIRKLIGHFALFGLSGVLSALAFAFHKKVPYFGHFPKELLPLPVGFFLALVTEFVQLFTDGRSGEIKDSIIDFSGFVLGLLIVFIISVCVSHKKNKKLKNSN